MFRVIEVVQDTELPVDSMVERLVALEAEYENKCSHLPDWAYTGYEK